MLFSINVYGTYMYLYPYRGNRCYSVKQAHDINYKLEYVIISKRVHFNNLE